MDLSIAPALARLFEELRLGRLVRITLRPLLRFPFLNLQLLQLKSI